MSWIDSQSTQSVACGDPCLCLPYFARAIRFWHSVWSLFVTRQGTTLPRPAPRYRESSYYVREHLPHRLRKKDPVQENRAHVSLACIQNLTFSYIILPAIYQATNKVRYKQSQCLGFARRPNERRSWIVRRGKGDWQICQIRLNDSNKLTWKINHGIGRLVLNSC